MSPRINRRAAPGFAHLATLVAAGLVPPQETFTLCCEVSPTEEFPPGVHHTDRCAFTLKGTTVVSYRATDLLALVDRGVLRMCTCVLNAAVGVEVPVGDLKALVWLNATAADPGTPRSAALELGHVYSGLGTVVLPQTPALRRLVDDRLTHLESERSRLVTTDEYRTGRLRRIGYGARRWLDARAANGSPYDGLLRVLGDLDVGISREDYSTETETRDDQLLADAARVTDACVWVRPSGSPGRGGEDSAWVWATMVSPPDHGKDIALALVPAAVTFTLDQMWFVPYAVDRGYTADMVRQAIELGPRDRVPDLLGALASAVL